MTVFGMDAIPRISRAQVFDALSSMANIAGYKALQSFPLLFFFFLLLLIFFPRIFLLLLFFPYRTFDYNPISEILHLVCLASYTASLTFYLRPSLRPRTTLDVSSRGRSPPPARSIL